MEQIQKSIEINKKNLTEKVLLNTKKLDTAQLHATKSAQKLHKLQKELTEKKIAIKKAKEEINNNNNYNTTNNTINNNTSNYNINNINNINNNNNNDNDSSFDGNTSGT